MSAAATHSEESSWAILLSLFCLSTKHDDTRSISDAVSSRSGSSGSTDNESYKEPEGILLYGGMLMDNGKQVVYENIICETPESHPRPNTATPDQPYLTAEETGTVGKTKLVKSVSSASKASTRTTKRLSKSIISGPSDFQHVSAGTPFAVPISQLPEIPAAVRHRQSWGPTLERSMSSQSKRRSLRLSYLPGPYQPPSSPDMAYEQQRRRRAKSMSGARPQRPFDLLNNPLPPVPDQRRRSRSLSAGPPPRTVVPSTDQAPSLPPLPPRLPLKAIPLPMSPELADKPAARVQKLPPRLPLKPAIVHKRWTSSPHLKDSTPSPDARSIESQRSYPPLAFHLPRKPSVDSTHSAEEYKDESAKAGHPARHRRTRSCTVSEMESFRKEIGAINIDLLREEVDLINKRQGVQGAGQAPVAHKTNRKHELDKMPPIPGSPSAATVLNSFLSSPEQCKRPRRRTISNAPHTYKHGESSSSSSLASSLASSPSPMTPTGPTLQQQQQQLKRRSYSDASIGSSIGSDNSDIDSYYTTSPKTEAPCAMVLKDSFYDHRRSLAATRRNRMSSPVNIGVAV